MNRTAPRWLRRLLPPAMSAGLVAGLLLGGCGRRSSPPAAEPTPQLPTSYNFSARSTDVVQRVTEFQLLASQLQLLNPSQHPPVLRQVFVALSNILPKLAGPQPGGVFIHQFSVVTNVRDQLSSRANRVYDTGLVDSGLIATYSALRDLGQTEFYRDDALTQKLDELAKRVSAVQGSPDALEHDLNVRDAVGAVSEVLLKLAGTLKDKVTTTSEIPPASGPSTAPATPGAATPAPAMPPEGAPATPPAPPATPPATPAPPRHRRDATHATSTARGTGGCGARNTTRAAGSSDATCTTGRHSARAADTTCCAGRDATGDPAERADDSGRHTAGNAGHAPAGDPARAGHARTVGSHTSRASAGDSCAAGDPQATGNPTRAAAFGRRK